ncbi:MAG: DUF2207 domain-containing protein [Candidatus Pacebacteria bacterium]|nr:DUF2207 domain-containing protein [Candidatus Paceibacterota bacterium]
MKKGIIYLLIILSGVFIDNNVVLANDQEVIRNFESNILVKEDSSVEIQETINYDFGFNQKHGIIRYIPFRYPLEDKILVLDYQIIFVQDEEQNNIQYSTYEEGNNFVIKIGSPNELISGQKTYIIKYILKGIINYFDDYDELFWNVTGNNWQLPIEHSTTYFALDNFFAEASLNDFQAICYTGLLGSKEQNCQIDKALSARVISFKSSNLNPKEGLTVAVNWPKGFTKEVEKQYIETTEGKIISPVNLYTPSGKISLFGRFLFALQYLLFFVPFIVFIILFSLWWKKGRNPRTVKSIMAEYEAPANVNPAEAHIIITEGLVNLGKMATATLIDLARRGYFIIKEEQKKILFFKSNDWKFIKTDKHKPEDLLSEYEKYLLDNIFEGKNEIFLSSLKNSSSASKQAKIKKDLEQAKVSLGKSLIEKKLIPENPFVLTKKLKIWQIVTTVLFLLVSFFVSICAGKPALGLFISFGGTFVIIIIFSIFIKIMPSLTEQGMEAKEKLKGFELFLKMVERDRVKFHFSPQAHPEKFAEYLPYAILFGVEKQWAKLFKDINAAVPEWYQGKQGMNLSSVVIASNIGNINSRINSSFVTAGFTAASGGSGFGSSGFSGGGFGGGGGGSW